MQKYPLSDEEWQFVEETGRGDSPRLQLALYLKCFQKLGYLPQIATIPKVIIIYIAQQRYPHMQMPVTKVTDTTRSTYRRAIHDYLQIRLYGDGGVAIITPIVQQATYTMSDPADLINVAIEQLILHRFELPAFSPYLTEHIKRFGEYVIDTDSMPPSLQPDKPFLTKDVLA